MCISVLFRESAKCDLKDVQKHLFLFLLKQDFAYKFRLRFFAFNKFFIARKRSLRRLCFYTCLLVILLTGEGVSAPVHAGIHPPDPRPGPETDDPPGADRPPLYSACWEIRATSGRYASYWNAFLLSVISVFLEIFNPFVQF